ncbi:MAG: proton-translocating NADH-quinone oxidoreductase, chain, partial [Thermoleophilia bacterium]|nr:proton-translocating NADH-quinone oxidoreductase, chain [Thermoleophilia bacterium]
VLLYGTALVYGATGSFDLAVIGDSDSRGILLFAGAALVLGGLAFKIGAAPMHWWTPDVYEGAGTPVTAFMSTATKAVGFLVLARVLVTAFGAESSTWVPIVAGLAVASIVIGNAGALGQLHLKRMLAYSSIAQAGYLLCGIVGWDTTGIPALVYALIVYTAMTLGAFAYVVVLEREIGRDATFADLAGRGWASEGRSIGHALPAFGLVVCSLSLAGIPPTAGFFSKFGLFDGAVESGYAWLAVVGALGSVVSLGYYLRVIVELYMREPNAARAAAAAVNLPAASTGDHRWSAGTQLPVVSGLAVALAGATLLLAFVPNKVFELGCDVKANLAQRGDDCTNVDAAAAPGPVAQTAPAAAE